MNKETLLLISGAACDREAWQHQEKHLSELVNIVIPDLKAATDLDNIIEQAIDNMPSQFLLAGHSWGGWLCFEILKRYPERIKKVCLLATSADIDTKNNLETRKERLKQAKNGHYKEICEFLSNLYVYQTTVKKNVFNMFFRNLDLFITQQEAAIKRESSLPLLNTLTKPVMMIVGRNDPVFFESSCLIAEKIPHAKLAIIEDCGHMLTMEMPQATTALMRLWLNATGYTTCPAAQPDDQAH